MDSRFVSKPEIRIYFDQNYAVYFPGQTITGRVDIVNGMHRQCKGIDMEFLGRAEASSTRFGKNFNASISTNNATINLAKKATNKANNITNNANVLNAEERYYRSKFSLWSDSSGSLPIGVQSFPFTFQLPLRCPASFQCATAKVVHQCSVVIRHPKERDTVSTQSYSVNTILDLNSKQMYKKVQNLSKQKFFGFLFWKHGPISLNVKLDRTGYVSGEDIVMNGTCINNSKKTIKLVKTQIMMEVTAKFKDQENKTESYSMKQKINKRNITRGNRYNFNNYRLNVPALPPSGLQGSNIIDIKYKVKITVVTSSKFDLEFPITIGSIPLQETFDRFQQPCVQSFPQSAPLPPCAPSVPPSAPSLETDVGFPLSTQPPNSSYGAMAGSMPPPPSAAPQEFPGLNMYPGLKPPSYDPAVQVELFEPRNSQLPDPDKVGFVPRYISYNLR